MLENIGYITELTAWHFYQGHMIGTCAWRGGNRSHFFRLTHSAKFWKVNTPLISQFRESIPCTGQTWRGWISVSVRQRHANHASLGALVWYAKLCQVSLVQDGIYTLRKIHTSSSLPPRSVPSAAFERDQHSSDGQWPFRDLWTCFFNNTVRSSLKSHQSNNSVDCSMRCGDFTTAVHNRFELKSLWWSCLVHAVHAPLWQLIRWGRRLFTCFVSALSPVNHKGLYRGWGRLS